jgi:hypothetical protein
MVPVRGLGLRVEWVKVVVPWFQMAKLAEFMENVVIDVTEQPG